MLNFEPMTLILYGVEAMQEQDIKMYFAPLLIAVDFLDESHCSVKFMTPKDMLLAFYEKLKSKNNVGDFASFENSLGII